MRQPILALCLLVPLVSACAAAAAGVGAGILISQEGTDNSTYVAKVNHDVRDAWTTAKIALGHASTKPIGAQDDLRTATAEIDGGKVTVTVEAFDLDQTVIKVSAKKYGINNGELAKMTLDRILSELDK
jgi:hypothetical protein